MDWANEAWRRLYTRYTANWLALSFDAQAVFMHLIRRVDEDGRLDLGRRGKAIVGTLIGHRDREAQIELAVDELVIDGCVEIHDTTLVIPNFIAAQTSEPESREKEEKEKKKQEKKEEKVGIGDLKIDTIDKKAKSVPSLAFPNYRKPRAVPITGQLGFPQITCQNENPQIACQAQNPQIPCQVPKITVPTESQITCQPENPQVPCQAQIASQVGNAQITCQVPNSTVPAESAGFDLSIPPKRRRMPVEAMEALYGYYPRKEGKKAGIKALERILAKAPDPMAELREVALAMKNYIRIIGAEGRDKTSIKHFGTFVNNWTDYRAENLDPATLPSRPPAPVVLPKVSEEDRQANLQDARGILDKLAGKLRVV